MKAAHALLQRALDMAPHYAATHSTLGHYMEVTGQIETAQSSYEKVTELEGDRAAGWLRLAALHFRQNRPHDALAAYRRAETCRGNQPLAETRLGEAYFLRGDWYAAYRWFTAAVERNADDPFPRMRLAQILDRAGRPDEARTRLELILKSTEYPEALKVAAEKELTSGNHQAAIEFYRRRLKAIPEDWVSTNNLALLLVQTNGSAKEASELIDRAIRLAPQPAAALQGTSGCVHWHAGRIDEAEPLLRQAITALPNNSWTRYCYGQVLRAQHRPAEAREQFLACQFLDPSFPRRDEVTRILAQLDQEEGVDRKQAEEASSPAQPKQPAGRAERSVVRGTPSQPSR
jgi:tetratricopeptide (TPR) repeat protein